MKFRCESQTLITAIKTVIVALPSKSANPVLDGVLIETGGNMVRLTCCDERLTIVTTMSAEVVESGRGIVPQDMLKRMIGNTSFAVALEDMREVLTGAYLEFSGGNATMVGLDGFRMAVCKVQTSGIVDECSAIIPVKAVSDIGKMLSDDPDGFVDLSIGGGKLHMSIGNTDVYAVLIQGQYIDYKNILPKKYGAVVTTGVKPFRDAVERAALIAKQGASNLLVLRITGNEMAVESKSEIGDVYETIDVLHDGADINIAFNVKYIIDVLRNVNDDEIRINFTGATSPCTIEPVNENGVTYLVLPVRTTAA